MAPPGGPLSDQGCHLNRFGDHFGVSFGRFSTPKWYQNQCPKNNNLWGWILWHFSRFGVPFLDAFSRSDCPRKRRTCVFFEMVLRFHMIFRVHRGRKTTHLANFWRHGTCRFSDNVSGHNMATFGIILGGLLRPWNGPEWRQKGHAKWSPKKDGFGPLRGVPLRLW